MSRQLRHARNARRGLRAAVVTAAVVAWAMPALPAGAKVIEHEHTHQVVDTLLPPPGEDFCGLHDVPFHAEVVDNFLLKTKDSSEIPYFADSFHATVTYTNPATGKTYTVVSSGSSHDHKIVDNGDGTISITTQDTGHTKVIGPTGEVLFTDSGLVRQTILVDINGTPADPEDDIFLGLVGTPTVRGPHDTLDRDFCADFMTFTS